MTQGLIRIRGARQHNLKNLDLDIRTGELTVVTGPSGSGKSSLVFDTLYAEGQRRYVETFSAYARQFLDRMDKPAVDKVEGVPPAIAIDQTNPVRSSRSTVGTMTELNDHLKLLFARAGQLFDRQTAQPVRHDTPETIYAELQQRCGIEPAPGRPKAASAPLGGGEPHAVGSVGAEVNPRIVLTFPVELPANTSAEQVEQWLSASGFTKVQAEREVGTPTGPRKVLDVVADRFRLGNAEKARAIEAIEVALKRGSGRLNVYRLMEEGEPELWRFSTGLHCPDSDLRYSDPIPSAFSFNSAVGACDSCRGFGRVIGVDYGLVIPNDKLTLRAGAVKTIQTPAWKEAQDDLMRHAEAAGIPRDTPWNKLTDEHKKWVINGSPNWNGKWNQQWYGIKRFFEYLESKAYKMHIRVLLSKYRSYTPCPTCAGARLKTESLLWRIGRKEDADAALEPGKRFMPEGVQWSREQLEALPGLCLHDLMLLPIDRLRQFFARMQLPVGDNAKGDAQAKPGEAQAKTGEAQALRLLHEEITTRLKYLCDVGIGYLTLDRQSRTLSGGEVQRINLTTALGTSLVNTLFVLDEPSIGLHQRDNDRLIATLQRLRDLGNSVIVVEHDADMMRCADHILDLGPGAGSHGGRIMAQGTVAQIMASPDSPTGQYLSGQRRIAVPARRTPWLPLREADAPTASAKNAFGQPLHAPPPAQHLGLQCLRVVGASGHNLQHIAVDFPIGLITCVTGVSGSGKSTLVNDTLYAEAARRLHRAATQPQPHEALLGLELIDKVICVDQAPIGRTPRSNPATYTGLFTPIRDLFAQAPTARERGYGPGRFSFNVAQASGGGRCEACQGDGLIKVEMHFLPDVYVACAVCHGQRYNRETLEVQWKGQNIAQVLDMTVEAALAFFADQPALARRLQTLMDVGLGYIRLGQSATTLSGGEAQRVKLALELGKRDTGRTLYILDEPTTGLHFADVELLLRVLQRLRDAGNTIVIIEHNLDVIKTADWLIDIGPEGGAGGGQVVAQGTPETVAAHPASHTGRYLLPYLEAATAGN